MNMLLQMEDSSLETRYKRSIVSNGTMLLTKSMPNIDLKQVLNFVRNLFQADSVDWMNMPQTIFNGKVNDKYLNTIFEG